MTNSKFMERTLRNPKHMRKRAAVICPTDFIEEYEGDFHLFLAQFYLSETRYQSACNKCRQQGHYIILDNGAAEEKAAITNDILMDACNQLRPDVLIAPDVIYDSTQTRQRTLAFLDEYADTIHDLGTQIMAVPQGSNLEEWKECMETFHSHPDIDWLGVSKFYTPKCRLGRLEPLMLMRSYGVVKPCHLLGVWDSPYSLLLERRFDFVKSTDTAKPIEFAIEGLPLLEWPKHKHLDDTEYMRYRRSMMTKETKTLMERNVRRYLNIFEHGE